MQQFNQLNKQTARQIENARRFDGMLQRKMVKLKVHMEFHVHTMMIAGNGKTQIKMEYFANNCIAFFFSNNMQHSFFVLPFKHLKYESNSKYYLKPALVAWCHNIPNMRPTTDWVGSLGISFRANALSRCENGETEYKRHSKPLIGRKCYANQWMSWEIINAL